MAAVADATIQGYSALAAGHSPATVVPPRTSAGDCGCGRALAEACYKLAGGQPLVTRVGPPLESTTPGAWYTMVPAMAAEGFFTPNVCVRPPCPSAALLPSYFQCSSLRNGMSTRQTSAGLLRFKRLVGSINHTGCTVYREGRERRDGLLRHSEEHRVYFKPYTRVPNSHGGGYCGPRAHKGVKYGADSKREGRSDELAHERLWLKRRVRSDLALFSASGR